MPRPAMMISRTLSTWVWVAASISMTSMSRPSAISTQASHVPHGSGVGPFSQLSARARIRAVVVLPTPRGPAKTNACATLADDVFEPLRAVLAGEHLVGHWELTIEDCRYWGIPLTQPGPTCCGSA